MSGKAQRPKTANKQSSIKGQRAQTTNGISAANNEGSNKQGPNRVELRSKRTMIPKSSVPCLHCGGLLVLPDTASHNKDQNITTNESSVNTTPKKQQSDTKTSGVTKNRSKSPQNAVNNKEKTMMEGLIQQIKLLDLEVEYLKNRRQHTSGGNEGSLMEQKPNFPISNQQPSSYAKFEKENEALRKQILQLKTELVEKSQKLEDLSIMSQSGKKNGKVLTDFDNSERQRLISSIADWQGKHEQAEIGVKQCEERYNVTLRQLEKQAIISNDAEKKIQGLMEEVEGQKEENRNLKAEMEAVRHDLHHKDSQFNELQDKFLQSSNHILEETIKGLKDENRNLQRKLKDSESKCSEFDTIRSQLESKNEKLVSENAELRSTLAELGKKLETEVRARENRDSRSLVEAQEAFAAKEREKGVRLEMSRLSAELDKERQKTKHLQEKVSSEGQKTTTLELRISTQKSRIAELECSVNLANESTNKIRKESLMHQEKINGLNKELGYKSDEIQELCSKLANTEHRLADADRRLEGLAAVQSHRWMEFARMADNMKELSSNMLMQSKTNTRKAAIRADLDEEIAD